MKRLFTLVLVVLALAVSSVAQDHPNTARGFNADSVYQFNDVDSVNLFNGNLVVSIPIGQQYQVGGNLSYGLHLVYNGQAWTYRPVQGDNYAVAARTANVALGWQLTLGELIAPKNVAHVNLAPEEQWSYIGPDGGRHRFFDVLHKEEEGNPFYAAGAENSAVAGYTRDGSYMRIVSEGFGPLGQNCTVYRYAVEMADGTRHIFRSSCANQQFDQRLYFLEKIEDRFGNKVEIAYLPDATKPEEATQWVITDNAHGDGAGGRTHTVELAKQPFNYYQGSGEIEERYAITSVKLAAFNSSQPAIYSFGTTYDLLSEPCKSGTPDEPLRRTGVRLLGHVLLPDGSAYQFTYRHGDGGTTCDDTSGHLEHMTLPTGGSVAYTVDGRIFPQYEPKPFDPDEPTRKQGNRDFTAPYYSSVAVTSRERFDYDGHSLGVWDYKTCFRNRPIGPDGKSSKPRELVVAADDPTGTRTLSYYSVDIVEDDDADYPGFEGGNLKEYALPFTRGSSAVAAGIPEEGYFLSTETVQGNGSCVDPNLSLCKVAVPCPDQVVQRTYVRYEMDDYLTSAPRDPNGGQSDLNRRPKGTITVMRKYDGQKWVDDTACGGICYSKVESSDFDGLGHYRTETRSSNIGTVLPRSTTTNYHRPGWPAVTYTPGGPINFLMIPASAPWLPSYFDTTSVREGTAAPQTLTRVCINESTGFLKWKRVYRGVNSDFLAVFTGDRGNVVGEAYYGGTSNPTDPSCTAVVDGGPAPDNASYAIAHEWSHGTRHRSHYVSSPFNTLDLDVDANTGLPRVSRDSAGVATTFTYDPMGRISGIIPTQAAKSFYSYNTLARPAHVSAIQIPAAGGDPLTESHTYYDGFGRLIQEKRRMPGGWATSNHEYDAAGRKVAQTVPVFFGEAAYSANLVAPKTHFSFDVLGRNVATTSPDGSVTATVYTGARNVDRSMAKDSVIAAKVSESYDGFGRLRSVTEYLDAASTPATTYYGYDFADRLTRVASSNDANPQQVRTFTYDLAGLLISEDHPEAKPTTYTYDARGHALTKTTGAIALSYTYDQAERPLSVSDSSGLLKTFTYGTLEGSPALGRLLTQVRHNRHDFDYEVTDTFVYDDAGRISKKETVVKPINGAATRTVHFSQDYDYTDLGQPATLQYPLCTSCTGLTHDARGIALAYQDGLLSGIAGVTAPIPESVGVPVRPGAQPFDIAHTASGMVEAVQHASSTGSTGVLDRYYPDPTGLPRPSRIEFTGAPDCALVLMQPVDQTIHSGQSATFSIAVAENATVKWYRGKRGDVTNFISAGSTLVTPPLTQTTEYWARVTSPDSECTTDSATVAANVCAAPLIITPAEDAGETRLVSNTEWPLSVDVSGASLQYVWTQSIDGAAPTVVGSAATFNFTPSVAMENHLVEIRVTITSGCNEATATRIVGRFHIDAPTAACEASFLLTLPPIVQVLPEEAVILEAALNRSDAFSYDFHWFRDGVPVKSETIDQPQNENTLIRSTYTFRVDSGSIMRVEAWANCGTSGAPTHSAHQNSQTFGLVRGECPTPQLTVNQTSIVVPAGQQNVTFVADSTWPDVLFQWYRGESGNTRFPIAGATSSTLTRPATVDTYWVRIITECGSSADSPTLTVASQNCAPIRLRQEPESATVTAGEPHTLLVDASWSGVMNYQWYVDNVADPAARSAAYSIRPIKTARYHVVVTGPSCHAAESRYAIVHVTSCPDVTVTQQPVDASIVAGASATMTIAATSPLALRYQWYEGESGDTSLPVAGAVSASLTRQPSKTTRYWVRLSFDDPTRCSVDSRTVTVNVCRPPVLASAVIPQTSSLPGQQRTLWVDATGDSLSYQWYRGPVGDTSTPLNSVLEMIRVNPIVTTSYWTRITSDCIGREDSTLDAGPIVVSVCPAITQHPQPVTVMPGTSATLTVQADRGDRIEWYRGAGGDLSSGILGTGATFVTPPVSVNTQFWARVYSGSCFRNSDPALVSICTQPDVSWAANIKKQIAAGEPQTIHISVQPDTGVLRTFYQGEAGDVANSVVLLGPGGDGGLPISPTTTTKYWVRAKMVDGSCYDDTNTLTIEVCIPTITAQPQSVMIDKISNPAATATLSVSANGGALTYQWFEGAAGDTTKPVASGTGASIVVSPTAATSYWVRVTGTCATRDSDAATVTLCANAVITQQPISTSVNQGTVHTLTVVATGNALHYQWYRGAAGDVSTPVGGDSSEYSKLITTTMDYWVKVTGQCGAAVNSAVARISVAPAITTQPASASITKDSAVTMQVVATGTYLAYQWYAGAGTTTPIAGATSASYTTPALTADASYWCRVTSGTAFTDSTLATVTVCQPRPANVTYTTQVSGSQVTLSVVGGAQSGESYQWYAGASGVTSTPAGTGSTVTVTPLQTTQYWVRTIRATCNADSATVTVTVCYPAITTQPQGGMINSGASKALTVAANGTGPLTYQWYTGASGTTTAPISGATSSTYNATPTVDTSYWVQVRSASGSGCVANSDAAVVTICQPAAITQQPISTSVTKGSNHTLSVVATGTNLSYQWYRGLTADTTNPVCGNASTCSVLMNSTTDYWVRVTGGSCGSAVNSTTAKISVAPTITTQPVSVSASSGSTATFSVVASGTQLTYQWYLGTGSTSPISGATNASYTTPALTADASYWCRVGSGSASTNSSVATATVCLARSANVTYTTQVSGSQITLSVVGGAVAGETYDWYRGATGDTTNRVGGGASLPLYPTESTTYWLRTTYSGGCHGDSAAITAKVCYPNITSHPASQTIAAGASATLTVAASGTPPFSYQWYVGASGTTTNPITGATNASLTITPSATTTYWVQVKSASAGTGCSAYSNAATVAVCQPAVITQEPASGSTTSTGNAILSVTATGDVIRYEWYQGASGVTTTPVGTNSNTLTITPGTTKSYWVRVVGTCGNDDSVAALISVYPKITTQPADVTTCANQPVTFTVNASGNPLTYQWYLGNVYDRANPIANATGASVTITPAATQNVWCELTSGNATTATRTATATVTPGPTVLTPSKTVNGSCATITARVATTDDGLVEYRWYRGALGDTTNFITTNKTTTVCPTVSTTYWVRVSYLSGGCFSDRAVTVP